MKETTLSKIIVLFFSLIFLLNFVFPSSLDSKSQDIFYPTIEVLEKQNQTLESYKQSLIANAANNRNSSVNNINGTSPLSGNIHIPVLLVKFSDRQPTLTLADINAAFNSPNYLNGAGTSVSKYYTKQSYGDLNITFDVYNWQTVPQTHAYYSQSYDTYFQLGIDSINLFNPSVDFSQYDNDGNGRIDGFILIFAGEMGNHPAGIWPHARIMKALNYNPVDGKYLGNIAFVPEIRYLTNQFEVSTTIHEFTHVLGLPDLYANTPNGGGDGPISNFTSMDFQVYPYCLNKPINLDAWSRYFFGWINPLVLTTDSPKEISLRSINDYPDSVILKNENMTSREFFLIENRHRNPNDPNNLDNCMFNGVLPDRGGLAIYHVDENKIEYDYPNNYVNWDPDGNWFDDTISHPGIMYEENLIFSYTINGSTSSLYFNLIYQGCDSFRFFDENKRICTDLYAIDDSTTRTYSGVANPFIRVNVFSSAQSPIIISKMLVGQETQTPIASQDSGTYFLNLSVALTTPTPNATIYYTLDGSTPTMSSTIYTSPITISQNTTLKAIAKKDNFYVSDILTKNYIVNQTVATPNASVSGGTYTSTQIVELISSTPNTSIRYTLDGTEPNRINSLYYNGPITISSSTTLKAKAFLYLGPTVFSSSNSSKSGSTALLGLSNLSSATVSWLYSPTMIEEYVISRNNKHKEIASISRDRPTITSEK